MLDFELSHLADDALLQNLATLVSRDRAVTAALLAHIAEADARRLYAPAGYPSMHEYCVMELRLSDEAAATRIRAARAARRYPVLFMALVEGRLHLTALRLLAPHLTDENAWDLIEMATHRKKSEIEEELSRRFGLPKPITASLRPIVVRSTASSVSVVPEGLTQHVPGRVACHTVPLLLSELAATSTVDGDPRELQESPALGPSSPALGPPSPTVSSATMAEPSSHVDRERAAALENTGRPNVETRYLLRVALSKATEIKLRRAQALLSHAVPTGDLAEVLDRALEQLIVELEKRKAGVGARETQRRAESGGKRHIPVAVRRAVWRRDGGRCTFVNKSGARCKADRWLEYDHVQPVARGGTATVDGIRLRCRAHNQLEAERIFGAEFMAGKRQERSRG